MEANDLVLQKRMLEMFYHISKITESEDVSDIRDNLHDLIKVVDETIDHYNDTQIINTKGYLIDVLDKLDVI